MDSMQLPAAELAALADLMAAPSRPARSENIPPPLPQRKPTPTPSKKIVSCQMLAVEPSVIRTVSGQKTRPTSSQDRRNTRDGARSVVRYWFLEVYSLKLRLKR